MTRSSSLALDRHATFLPSLACLTLAALGAAQSGTTGTPTTAAPPTETPASRPQDPRSGERVIVTATKRPTSAFDAPATVDVISEDQITQRNYRTVPQILRDTPGVMVQETAHGHGSPYIRGFTSQRTLLQIDGVRLNHSAFREGPNQYWNTVDPLGLERVEVVKGPSSVLYGSDAVGGTVSAFTRDPETFGEGPGLETGGALRLRYSDAENSIVGRAQFDFGYTAEDGTRTGLLVGGTVKRFGDLEAGAYTGNQPDTGYDDDAYDFKLVHWLDDDTRLVFMHHRVRQDDVPRTHRTTSANGWRGTSVGSDQRRSFDQDRHLTYLQFHRDAETGWFDGLHANLSWHGHDEVRDRIRGSGAQEFQGFEVGQLGAWVSADADTSSGDWSFGVELYHDEVDSFYRDATPSAAEMIQGPVGDDATYTMLGVFAENRIQICDRFDATLGVRFNYVAADADSVRDPSTDTQISIDDSWDRFVGSARFGYDLDPGRLRAFGGVSQGFRAPNLSDLTRFDSARSNEFEIPATGLSPEDYIQYEIGLKAQGDSYRGEVSYFWLDVEDQIVRFPTGNTNGSGDTEITKANVGDGYAYGIEVGGAVDLCETFEIFGNGTYLEGKIENFENSGSTLQESYLTRLMPLTLQTGVRWDEIEGRGWAEASVRFADTADKLSFGDRRDTERVPAGGTPSFTVLDLRGGWKLSDSTTLTVGMENVTDDDYRIHGSGQNQPGRNVFFAVETRF